MRVLNNQLQDVGHEREHQLPLPSASAPPAHVMLTRANAYAWSSPSASARSLRSDIDGAHRVPTQTALMTMNSNCAIVSTTILLLQVRCSSIAVATTVVVVESGKSRKKRS